ncbi:MAG: hypothetical protein JWO50_342 [Candidatus Kaiserbacteria bacterium]|nr:hypothetical protein [Candidatus Kaiserbacteria bacterium]
MDPETALRLSLLEEKINEIHKYTKRLYTIFIWTGVVTVAMFVLPLIGLIFVIPSFLSSYGSIGSAGDAPSQTAPPASMQSATDYANQLKSLLQ